MQQIERYGVIALLFLLVTIIVVALWDGGTPTHAGEDRADAQLEQPSTPSAVERERTDRRARPNQERSTLPEDRRAFARGGETRPSGRRVTLDPNRNSDLGQSNSRMRPRMPVHQNPAAAASYTRQPAQPAFSPAERQPGSTVHYDDQGRIATERVERPEAARRPISQPTPQPVVQPVSQPVVRPQVPPASGRTYRVQPGDSLERIARRELGDGQRWKEIQVLNGISRPETIAVGAVLKLPAGGQPQVQTQPTAVTERPAAVRSAAGTYTVQPGDVLSRIAEKELGSAKRYVDIVAANPGLKPDKLRVGMVLKMPQGATRTAQPAKGQKPAAKAAPDKRFVVH